MPVYADPRNPFLRAAAPPNALDLMPSPFTAVIRGGLPAERAVAEFFGRRYPRLWASVPEVAFAPGNALNRIVADIMPETAGGEVLGMFSPATKNIMTREGQYGMDLFETLAHEFRHAWQHAKPAREARFATSALREADAERAAENVMNMLRRRSTR